VFVRLFVVYIFVFFSQYDYLVIKSCTQKITFLSESFFQKYKSNFGLEIPILKKIMSKIKILASVISSVRNLPRRH